MFFGDFSQLKQVSGTALASNPELGVGSNATHGNNCLGALRKAMEEQNFGLAASRNRSIAKNQCSGGFWFALDREN